MPIVPVLHQEQADPQADALPTPSYEPQAKKDGDLRDKLADALRKQVARQQAVTTAFLDAFAATNLDEQTADSPVAWDYTALRQTAKQEEKLAGQQHQNDALDKTRHWICQVGELTPDNRSLQTYLDLQLPVYRAQLEENGMSAVQAQQTAEQLYAHTVEKHIVRSLSAGDWNKAGQVLEAQREHLSAPVQQRCAEQIRYSFAQAQGRELWERAALDTSSVEQTREKALAGLQEPDEELHAQICAEIEHLAQTRHREQAASRAEIFGQLAQLNARQQEDLLNTQTVLDGNWLNRARRVVSHSGKPASLAQQNWFVKNYFNGELDVDKALDKGQCAACDYFRLQAVVQGRAGGHATNTDEWLCRGMRAFMRKQGFEDKEITRAVYTVLSGAADESGRVARWKEIKTLLTC